MAQHVIRMSQLATSGEKMGLLPVSPATIWRWVAAGRFPKPFKLGAGTTVWDASAVEAFIAAQQETA
jgi:predicted DNA-binding transcriptional regulator AlpA